MLIGYKSLQQELSCFEGNQAKEDALLKLQKAGCLKIYFDIDEQKPQLIEAFNSFNRGDILVLTSSRDLGKNLLFIVQTIQKLKHKGVHLQILDTNSLYPVDNLEGDFLESLLPLKTIATSHQKSVGRPPISQDVIQSIILLKTFRQFTITKLCSLTNISRTTYYNLFPKNNS